MKFGGKGTLVAVSTIEDVMKVVNNNTSFIEKVLNKHTKQIKKIKFLSFLNAAGILYLIADNKKKSDDIDRIKEEQRKLTDDLNNLSNSSEYDPDKDKEFDDDFWG